MKVTLPELLGRVVIAASELSDPPTHGLGHAALAGQQR
jgi:hypothetical protein